MGTSPQEFGANILRLCPVTVRLDTGRVNESAPKEGEAHAKQRYTWPWFVLAGVVLGIVLAIIWMSHEVERTRRNREFNSPAQAK